MRHAILSALCIAVLAVTSFAEDAAKPGELKPEPSTLHCLAVRWPILGDDNGNAVVEVKYRKSGAKDWKNALPLHRTTKEATAAQRDQWGWEMITLAPERIAGGRLFAGSIVDLDEDSEYEATFALKDPDGGNTEKTLKMRTIAEPKEPASMRQRYVVPGEGGGTGSKQDPFKGLQSAADAAEPGDLILVQPGTYAIKGSVKIPKGGQAGKPIIFRGAEGGEAIVDGIDENNGEDRLVDGEGVDHIWLENLTFQNRHYVIVAHESAHWVIRRCRFQHFTAGFTAHNGNYERSQGHFISDNLFHGPTEWPRTKGIESFTAVHMSGAGHVVCFNRMEHVGDGIHGTGYGHLSASDYHNNVICVATDDGLESDYSETNVRLYRNCIVNCAHGLSAQPAQGGPIYFFRNVIYNATFTPFKLHNDTCGVFLFNNTSLRKGTALVIQPSDETVTDVHFRNNLLIGTGGAAIATTGRMTDCDFDGDGYGAFDEFCSSWNGEHWRTAEEAKAAGKIYAKIGAFRIDPSKCFFKGLVAPADPNTKYLPENLDFRLSESSDAVDKGVVLANITDGFAGKAPDLGAIEFGQAMPPVGPRAVK